MDVLQHQITKETVKEAWNTMNIVFKEHTSIKQANLQSLLRNYEILVMGDNESVDAFASCVASLVNRICALGENLMEASSLRLFMCAAPSQYLQIVMAMKQCVNS